ncbi:MAG: nucleotidyl transferase AbiEii/AbiGii toxin family protein [Bdellovibrio sp.]
MLFYELIEAFDKENLKYALVGGYALALHGLVRATVDVDFVLTLTQKDFELAEKTLLSLGLQSRLPIRGQDIIKMRKEYIDKRNLIAWSFVDFSNPSRQVDILITENLKDLDTERISIRGKKVTVATLKELLRMKTASDRPQDLIDAQNIKAKLHEKK